MVRNGSSSAVTGRKTRGEADRQYHKNKLRYMRRHFLSEPWHCNILIAMQWHGRTFFQSSFVKIISVQRQIFDTL